VPALSALAEGQLLTQDPYANRRSGLRALAALLRGLTRERPMVLELDDLQWSDMESVELLEALFESRITLFVMGTTWEEGIAPHRPLQHFLKAYRSPKVRQLKLGPLSVDDLKEMARGGAIEVTTQTLQRVHQESAGAPYWAWELLRHS